jgi:hypothetical protein
MRPRSRSAVQKDFCLVSRLSRARPFVERHGTGNTSRICADRRPARARRERCGFRPPAVAPARLVAYLKEIREGNCIARRLFAVAPRHPARKSPSCAVTTVGLSAPPSRRTQVNDNQRLGTRCAGKHARYCCRLFASTSCPGLLEGFGDLPRQGRISRPC